VQNRRPKNPREKLSGRKKKKFREVLPSIGYNAAIEFLLQDFLKYFAQRFRWFRKCAHIDHNAESQ
jgi:hypothetical protein